MWRWTTEGETKRERDSYRVCDHVLQAEEVWMNWMETERKGSKVA